MDQDLSRTRATASLLITFIYVVALTVGLEDKPLGPAHLLEKPPQTNYKTPLHKKDTKSRELRRIKHRK